MKRIILAGVFSLIALFLSTNLFAKTFEREYTYRASEADSKITARSIALNQVKTALLEEIGVYIESTFDDKNTESKTGIEQLSQQQLVSITAGVTETKVLVEQWDGQTYYMKAAITVDIDDVKKKIEKIAKDRDKTRELEAVKQKADEAFKQIELVQAELAKTKDENKKLKLQKEYQVNSNQLSAADWFQMGYNASQLKEYDKAIHYYGKVISVNSEYYVGATRESEWSKNSLTIAARYNMGLVYYEREDYDNAIEQFEKIVSIDSKFSKAYDIMGDVYIDKNEINKAIEQYQKAINIDSGDFSAYYNIGVAYVNKGEMDIAIQYFKKAININPKYLSAYKNLGIIYGRKSDYEKSIYWAKQAAKLGDETSQKFLRSQNVDW